MPYDASRHLVAQPAPGGGVRLKLRTRFRDQRETFISEKDNVARGREMRTDADAEGENEGGGDDTTRQVIATFGPLLPGQTCEFEEQENGLMAIVVVSPSDDYPGEGDGPAANGTTDRRSRYLISSLGGEARRLAEQNAVNKRYYGRK